MLNSKQVTRVQLKKKKRKNIDNVKNITFRVITFIIVLDISSRYLKLGANGRNNSQHCWANNSGSCYVRVGSSVQTDATTSNNAGTCSATWEGYNP